MNYDNAEPKILKTLKSDGNVINESKEVINPTSDYWKKLYDQTDPKVDKILHSDGTITDSDNNLIQDTNEFNVQKYNQAEPIPAKYLHSDGTIDENPGGSGADLEDNHQTTIDVSTYTEPVEIEPSSGKDGMKKATVTLSNIPSGTKTLYYYSSKNGEYLNIGDSGVYGFYSTDLITESDVDYTLIYGEMSGGIEIPDTTRGRESFTVRNGVVYFEEIELQRHSNLDVTL